MTGKSIVLLRNEGNLLPFKSVGAIAIIGPLADSKLDMLAAGPPKGITRGRFRAGWRSRGGERQGAL